MAQKVLYTLSCLVLSFSAFAQQGMGVGNNNPQEMLDVSGAIKIGTTTNSNTGTIRWNGTNFQGYNGTVWVDLDSQGGADTDWAISGSNQYSAVSGNVGIGTTSPLGKLHLEGAGELLRVNGSGTNVTLSRWYVGGSPRMEFSSLAASGGHLTVYNSIGTYSTRIAADAPSFFRFSNVGIGTDSPSASLDVEGSFQYVDGNQTSGMVLASDANGNASWADPNALVTSGDSDWTVSGNDQYSAVSGNVGIGTTSPTTKLDVNGQIRMSTGANVGYVPVSDANGVMTWTDPNTVVAPTITNTLDAAYDQGGAGAGRVIDATDGTVAITGEDGIMVSGTFGSGLAVGDAGGIVEGAGTRMFFNPNKAAIRAGRVTGTQWNDANIGDYSTAMGDRTTASGEGATAMGRITTASGQGATAMGNNGIASGIGSTAMGQATTASGPVSTAMGYQTNASGADATAMGYQTNALGDQSTAMGGGTTASGLRSTAMGFSTTASGPVSTAMGSNTTASGVRSTAMGQATTAPSFVETAVGRYNTIYTPASATGWDAADRLFVIGNGTGTGVNSSNALTIYKDGKMNINDAYDMPTVGGSAGQVLTTNGSVASWQDPSNDGDWTVSGNDQYSAVSGNVGIGTTTPDRQLNIGSGTGGQLLFSREDSNTNTDEVMGEILFDNTDNTAVSSVDAAVVIRGAASQDQGNSNKGGYLSILTKDNAGSGAAATERVRVAANGNVGIGTASPAAKLDVAGTAALNDNQLRLRGGADGNHYLSYIGGSFNGAKLTGFNNVILNTVSGGDALIVTGNRVGIGTTAPIAPLHVEAQSSPTYGNFTYYAFQANAGGGSCCAGTVNNVSIHASGRVMASEFDAFSDARIKNVIEISDSEQDLNKLLGIEITDYRMKDKAKDIKLYKKVIAQQVEEVYPEAVSQITDVIPNIYSLADIENGFVSLKADVKAGDRIKLILESGTEMVTVTNVEENGFLIDSDLNEQAFVYGIEVDDFRTVDYEAISMLNVSATQELFKMIKQLQVENAELKSAVTDFEAMAEEIEKLKEWTKFKQEASNDQ